MNIITTVEKPAGHQVIFLPTYSPDFNDIEHDFSALKRARMYSKEDVSLAEFDKIGITNEQLRDINKKITYTM